MAFIDKAYFVGENNIPETANQNVSERLTFFIEKYEDELLRSLLGDLLYEAFITGTKDIADADIDQRWKDLLIGKTYQDLSGNSVNWMGIKKASTKQSIVANYVYYWYMRDKATVTTSVGEVDVKADNSSSKATSKLKLARAWNEMVQWNRSLMMFLDVNKETYPEWNRISVIRDRYNLLSTINIFNI